MSSLPPAVQMNGGQERLCLLDANWEKFNSILQGIMFTASSSLWCCRRFSCRFDWCCGSRRKLPCCLLEQRLLQVNYINMEQRGNGWPFSREYWPDNEGSLISLWRIIQDDLEDMDNYRCCFSFLLEVQKWKYSFFLFEGRISSE